MIIAVDFDNTLALGNTGYISTLRPNAALIERLKKVRAEINPEIVIVTARGAKDGLKRKGREKKYTAALSEWLTRHGVPFDRISFAKEYANLYIDDQTIRPYDQFFGLKSEFTGNKVVLAGGMAIKSSQTAPLEFEWYKTATMFDLPVPGVLFCNSDCIITERVNATGKPPAAVDFIKLLHLFRQLPPPANVDYQTYLDNLTPVPDMSENAVRCVERLKDLAHLGTFFHGDLSTTNVLVTPDGTPYLIDPNCKHIFGSYLTDAGKAVFSLIAYEAQFGEAKKIVDEFGLEVWYFAVAEGLRVCKYRPEYISFVNNIADLCA